MRVVLGSDRAGFRLKQRLIQELRLDCHEVPDLGTHDTAAVDCPRVALELARAFLAADFGDEPRHRDRLEKVTALERRYPHGATE